MKRINLKAGFVELYDSMHALPAVAENWYHYYLINQAGTGNSLEDVRRHHSGAVLRLQAQDTEGALIELQNADFTLQNMDMHYNPLHCAWACLIHNVNGVPLSGYEHDELGEVVARLSKDGLTKEMLETSLEDIKKNSIRSYVTISPTTETEWTETHGHDWRNDVSSWLPKLSEPSVPTAKKRKKNTKRRL